MQVPFADAHTRTPLMGASRTLLDAVRTNAPDQDDFARTGSFQSGRMKWQV